MTTKLTVLISAGALGVAVAGCGTAKAPGVVLVPSSGATADSTTASTTASATTTSSSTATVTTPASGPLSKEPTIAAGKGSPPKKLVVNDLVKGTGATVTSANDTITVNYVGALYKNGKVFDASWKRNQTFTTPLTGVIPGWQKGLVGQKVGSRVQLIIPPALAYQNQAQSGIPAGSTLIFDIDLLKVAPAS